MGVYGGMLSEWQFSSPQKVILGKCQSFVNSIFYWNMQVRIIVNCTYLLNNIICFSKSNGFVLGWRYWLQTVWPWPEG